MTTTTMIKPRMMALPHTNNEVSSLDIECGILFIKKTRIHTHILHQFQPNEMMLLPHFYVVRNLFFFSPSFIACDRLLIAVDFVGVSFVLPATFDKIYRQCYEPTKTDATRNDDGITKTREQFPIIFFAMLLLQWNELNIYDSKQMFDGHLIESKFWPFWSTLHPNDSTWL